MIASVALHDNNGIRYSQVLFYDNKNSIVFPINLMGGYQWYFYNRPWFHLGVAIKVHIGYTNYNEKFYDSYYDGRWYATDMTAHGIQYGLEAKFLWDFLNKGNHSLGVSVAPLGFEGSSIIWQEYHTWDLGGIKKHVRTDTKGTQTAFTYTFSGGLHYYYDINHQLFVYYKYRFYSDIVSMPRPGKAKYAFAPSHTLMTGYAYKF